MHLLYVDRKTYTSLLLKSDLYYVLYIMCALCIMDALRIDFIDSIVIYFYRFHQKSIDRIK